MNTFQQWQLDNDIDDVLRVCTYSIVGADESYNVRHKTMLHLENNILKIQGKIPGV